MKPFEKALFLLFIFTIPVQLGKHFWPSFSFINGIRIDYLSPILYVSDILIALLFIVSFLRLKKQLFSFLFSPLSLMFLLVFIVGLFYAVSPYALIFGILKFVEVSFLGFYVAKSVKKDIKTPLFFVLLLGSLVEIIILFFQFFSQHSLGGPFYFLGERTFNSSTIGIATFNLAGKLFLRPYGTFPHPNVLAFYLFFVFTLILFAWQAKEKIFPVLKTVILLFLLLGIILTFSRIIILLTFCNLSIWFFKQKIKNKRLWFIPGFILLILLTCALFSRFTSSIVKDSLLRFDLIKISISTFSNYPFFGVGLNNFYYHEILYQKTINPTLLQPVHNIYLLWLVQTGIVGLIPAGLFVRKTAREALLKFRSKKFDVSFNNSIIILLVSSAIVGLFDHYLLTLQQGQILLMFLIGFVYAPISE